MRYYIYVRYYYLQYMGREVYMLAVPKKKLDTNDKYLQQLEDIKIRVPKGYRDVIKKFAIEQGYNNVNQLVIGLINEKMEIVEYNERIPNGIRDVKQKMENS